MAIYDTRDDAIWGAVSTHTHTADLFNWQCRHCYRINGVCGTCDAPDTCKGCGRDY